MQTNIFNRMAKWIKCRLFLFIAHGEKDVNLNKWETITFYFKLCQSFFSDWKIQQEIKIFFIEYEDRDINKRLFLLYAEKQRINTSCFLKQFFQSVLNSNLEITIFQCIISELHQMGMYFLRDGIRKST